MVLCTPPRALPPFTLDGTPHNVGRIGRRREGLSAGPQIQVSSCEEMTSIEDGMPAILTGRNSEFFYAKLSWPAECPVKTGAPPVGIGFRFFS